MVVSINRNTGGLVPDGTPGAMTEYFKTEDYDRIVAQGYNPQDLGEQADDEAFDIF